MKKFYQKSEVWFSVFFIILYVITNSYLMQLSNKVEMDMLFTIPMNLLLVGILLVFIKKNELFSYYGLGKVQTKARNLLFYVPLMIIATVNIWMGVSNRMDELHTVIYFVAMLVTGVIEELLFRGFLYRAIAKKSTKKAIMISSILFGAGHIVNMFNGSGRERLETICQLFYAVSIGFLFAAVLYTGKSLIPCMITHAIFNALSVFCNEAAFDRIQIPISIALCVISGISAILIFQKSGKELQNE